MSSGSMPLFVLAADTPEQIRLFTGIARYLDRRGADVRLYVPRGVEAGPWRVEWGALLHAADETAAAAGTVDVPESVGRYEAWRAGWSDAQRRERASQLMRFWTATFDQAAGATLVVWNGRDSTFVEAAVHAARAAGLEPLFMELGPLRREPMTVAISAGGVNAAARFRRSDLLASPLGDREAAALRAARARYRAPLMAEQARTPLPAAPFAFLPLQVDDDTQLFYYMPHFASQEQLVAAVAAALPPGVPLALKLHPLANERRGRGIYEPLLRPQDWIASPRSDTGALLAAAGAIITNNSSAGVEGLLLERPVVVLGDAHYARRGFTFDAAPHAASGNLGACMRAALRGALDAEQAARRDRYLYELLFHQLVEVAKHPLHSTLGDEDLDRLALRLIDQVSPLRSGADWTGVFREVQAQQQRIAAALRRVVAPPEASVLIASPTDAAWLAGCEIAPVVRWDELSRADDAVRRRTAWLVAPDLSPASRQSLLHALRELGARAAHDALRALSATPCDFATSRFNQLPRGMRDSLYARSEYWDYYLETSGIPPDDAPAKQVAAQTIATEIAGLSPQALLEYGCGDGRILSPLLKCTTPLGTQVFGMDSSERMLTLARARVPQSPRLTLLPADARDGLPLGDASIDVTLTCGALQHVPAGALATVMGELSRVTRRALVHWEAGEALEPSPSEHYTRPETSQRIHAEIFNQRGPVQALVRDVRALTGQPSLLATYRCDAPLLSVLTLHAIGRPDPEVESFDYRNMFLPLERFVAAIDGLLRSGWRFVTLGEAAASFADGCDVPRKSVALTFDDGFASVFELAYPALAERGIRATVFAPTAFIGAAFSGNARGGGGSAVPTMTAGQLRRLHECGWDVGAHTCTHPLMAALSDAEAQRELIDSRRELAEILGQPPDLFAFPYGQPGDAFHPRHVEMARAAGYRVICGTQPGFVSPTTAGQVWPRNGVDFDDTPGSLLDRLAATHRAVSGWPAAAATGPTLADRVRRVVQQCVTRGVQRIALYGAGQHTARLLQNAPLWPLSVLAIVDDDERLRGAQRFGLPIRSPQELPALGLDAVLISSDRYEDAIYRRLRPLAGPAFSVLRLYAESDA